MTRRAPTQTKVASETHVATIVSQIVVAAAIAVPLGLFAAAAGILTARSQSGQVRVAFYTNTAVASPSPSPTPASGSYALASPNISVTGAWYNTVRLQWAAVPGASVYEVYGNGVLLASLAQEPSGVYWVNNLSMGTTYWMTAVALGASGKSASSAPKKAETPKAPDEKKSGCYKSAILHGDGSRQMNIACPNPVPEDALACQNAANQLGQAVANFKCPAVENCAKYKFAVQTETACDSLDTEEAAEIIDAGGDPNTKAGNSIINCHKTRLVLCATAADIGNALMP